MTSECDRRVTLRYIIRAPSIRAFIKTSPITLTAMHKTDHFCTPLLLRVSDEHQMQITLSISHSKSTDSHKCRSESEWYSSRIEWHGDTDLLSRFWHWLTNCTWRWLQWKNWLKLLRVVPEISYFQIGMLLVTAGFEESWSTEHAMALILKWQ